MTVRMSRSAFQAHYSDIEEDVLTRLYPAYEDGYEQGLTYPWEPLPDMPKPARSELGLLANMLILYLIGWLDGRSDAQREVLIATPLGVR